MAKALMRLVENQSLMVELTVHGTMAEFRQFAEDAERASHRGPFIYRLRQAIESMQRKLDTTLQEKVESD